MDHPSVREVKVFYCYAREDREIQERLEHHLAHLKRRYHFSTWSERLILPGENWQAANEAHLNAADLVLLLISPDFMSSNYCYNQEMRLALERQARDEVQVIPILVRPAYWEGAPFSHLHMLPANGTPLTRWPDQDEAFQDIVSGIHTTLHALPGISDIQAGQEPVTPEPPGQPMASQGQASAAHRDETTSTQINVSGHVQGAIVNLGGGTNVQGNLTINLQDMQQS